MPLINISPVSTRAESTVHNHAAAGIVLDFGRKWINLFPSLLSTFLTEVKILCSNPRLQTIDNHYLTRGHLLRTVTYTLWLSIAQIFSGEKLQFGVGNISLHFVQANCEMYVTEPPAVLFTVVRCRKLFLLSSNFHSDHTLHLNAMKRLWLRLPPSKLTAIVNLCCLTEPANYKMWLWIQNYANIISLSCFKF